jgi:hypothetical protein
MRTFLRKVEEAIASGDKGAAAEALKAAQPEIMRAAQKGIVHKNTASRKVSRLAHRIERARFLITARAERFKTFTTRPKGRVFVCRPAA